MQPAWISALTFLLVSALVGFGMLAAARLLRVRSRVAQSELKLRTSECGEESSGSAWLQFHARYYLVALFFVLFDVEAVFLFPWAVVGRAMGHAGFYAATSFVLILMLGWLYAIRKEALRWL